MLLINLNRQSKTPLYKQVFNSLKELIDLTTLKPGDKLPSSRVLSQQLGINRTTIYKAYEELWSLGYIESRPGSYSIVRKRNEIATPVNKNRKTIIEWDDVVSKNSKNLTQWIENRQTKTIDETNKINFIPISPEPKVLPVDEFRKSLNYVLKKSSGSELLQYGDSAGYKPLRKFIASQMQMHSMSVTEDEVMITSGSQNGIELILKFLVSDGKSVVVESPTYSSIIPLLKFYNADIVEVPMNKEGMDLDELEKVVAKKRIGLVYTMTNFQNPTGITTTQQHREKLLQICENNKIPLVEDGFVEEMKYFGKSVLPIKSMDVNNIVFYLGTFSKFLFPGLRIGWVCADKKCIEKLSTIKKVTDISGNILNQAAIEHFCRSGFYDLHIKRVHKLYKKRMVTALKSIQEFLPLRNIEYTKPSGGYSIFIQIKKSKKSEDEIVEEIESRGVLVTPSKYAYIKKPDKPGFRLSIGHLDTEEIKIGLERIGEVLKKL